jgi:malonyl-CoA/methylmalonyl-CoA synthetase
MTNHLFQKIRNGAEGRETQLFLETPSGLALAYADMIALSGRYAKALQVLGLKPGDRLVAQVEKSPQALVLYLGAIRAGAIFLPLNSAYTASEVDYFLRDSEPKILVCDPARREDLAKVAASAGVGAVETLGPDGGGSLPSRCNDHAPSFEDIDRAANDLAAILYTSGTTGRSKGAMLTHGNLASNAEALVAVWRFSPQDVLLHALPIYHTHGLFVAVNTMLLCGGKIIFLPKFDPAECLALMPRASVMMGVPTFFTRLLRRDNLSRESTAHMRLFISGSAPLLAETQRAWLQRTGHVILERYGMTETGMNASNPYEGERRAGTVGFPLPGVELRITNPETGKPLSQGETGVIEVRGPNVFKGYWRNPEKTAQEFRSDGFFITGDLGQIDADGYVHIVGRAKDLVITGGLNVYPKEVETEIDALPGVIESAVVGLAHEDFGEAVAAIVVPAPGASLDEQSVQEALTKKLGRFKVPKRVLFVDELPRNAMGKVQKNLLRESFGGLFAPRVKSS